MTRQRRYGDDTPFGRWLREQKNLDSRQHAFTANDADWIFHQYRTPADVNGTRDVQLMMLCEVKTHMAEPAPSQRETMYFLHQLMAKKTQLLKLNGDKIAVWCLGAYVLRMSGTSPDDSTTILWGRFEDGVLKWSVVEVGTLIEILGFKRYPDTLMSLSLRRHHRTREVEAEHETPWGAKVAIPIIQRS